MIGDKKPTIDSADFLYLTWEIFSYTAGHTKKTGGCSPIRWPVFGPYAFLYLATVMFKDLEN